jgi:hypothetical protein
MTKYTLEDWQALELERIDSTWRNPKPQTIYVGVRSKSEKPSQSTKAEKPIQVPKTLIDEEAKKIYYNAGRFMSGARDKVAVSAYRIYELLEGLSE